MELICRIVKQHPLQTRQYTDRNGMLQTFTSVGLNLASGTDTLFAEITGEDAVRCGQMSDQYFYKVDLSARAEAWTDKDGNQRNGTRLYVNRIAIL